MLQAISATIVLMKKYLDQPVISLSENKTINLIIIFAPFLNLLAGINIDIYAPSMPAITAFFHTSSVITKNTITLSILGWAVGAILFGVLIDNLGRKRILATGVGLYCICCFITPFVDSIIQLMVLRFIQGFLLSTISVGCRALIIDTVKGPRYPIAILYTSLGYGLGPIIGPFIGSFIQHYFDWQANFIFLGVMSGATLLVLMLFIRESLPEKQPVQLAFVSKRLLLFLQNKKFMAGVMIGGLTSTQLMLYPVVAPFIVEGILKHSVIIYGYSALIIGLGYFIGTVLNRILQKYCRQFTVCDIGIWVGFTGVALSFLYSVIWPLNLFSLIIPILFYCVSAGLVFPNVMAINLKCFPNNAGFAGAVQSCIILLVSSLGVYTVSHIHIESLWPVGLSFSCLLIIEAGFYFIIYKAKKYSD